MSNIWQLKLSMVFNGLRHLENVLFTSYVCWVLTRSFHIFWNILLPSNDRFLTTFTTLGKQIL